jgi:uncharacterized protein (TIGR03435 family)
MRMVIRAAVLLAAIAISVTIGTLSDSHLRAQTPIVAETTNRVFEVASVKPNKSGSHSSGDSISDRAGRFTANNESIRDFIRTAYRLQSFQIVNLPGWADDARFDIASKAEGPAKSNDLRVMLQALLAERFKLVTHREAREMPVYNLVLAKSDRKPGDNLRASKCLPPKCGNTETNNLVLREEGVTLDGFTEWLSSRVTRIVLNKTGLDGPYDIDLAWSNDPAVDPSHPSLFTALQEQLGLKLESTKGSVDVLVIDHVEQPTPD